MSTVDTEASLVRVQREDFSIDEEINRVRNRSTRIGGIATFLGTARDRSNDRDVSRITFEYYEGMAQKKLREIRERALQDFDVIEVLILHRYGEIDIGENIVLIRRGRYASGGCIQGVQMVYRRTETDYADLEM